MNADLELMEVVKGIVEKRGSGAIERAREEILALDYKDGMISSALKYFAQTTLNNALPVFPALISLSCEAVDGKNGKTTTIGAAMTLIAVAADIHDDIIDQSEIKYSKKTVLGKFGADVALLTGDALLFHGLMLLSKECDILKKKQKEAIMRFTSNAFIEISMAETKEKLLKKKADVTPQEYFEIIKLKAAVPETHCKIGGVLGNADEVTIEALGRYGRDFGVVSTVRDEFIDLMDFSELASRVRKECAPLPMLYALQNLEIRDQIKAFTENARSTKRMTKKIMKLVLASPQVQELKNDLDAVIKHGLQAIAFIENESIKKELTILTEAMIEGIYTK
jgi:geranylgeranyl pyrophosphate synthase